MSRTCDLSEKKSMVGNRVSHAKNRTKVRLLPNVQNKKIYSTKLGKYVKLKVCTKALRTINKIGIEAYCAKVGLSLSH
ncbi:MAG: 50S ribosomal protein L28 [Bdellovibrionota bacterium]